MGKKIKRIFVSICIVTGIALLAVPFYYHFHGQNETDKLIEQFEKTLRTMKMRQKNRKKRAKSRPPLVKKMQPYFQGKMSLALLRLKP